MFRPLTFSKESSPAGERRESVPPTGWTSQAPVDWVHRGFNSLWLALGAAAVLGAFVGADGRLRDAARAGRPTVGTDAPFDDGIEPALGGVHLAVARVVTGSRTTVVPISSVVVLKGTPFVFVAEPALHLFAATPVELGERVDGEQRITAGLSAGQSVAMGDLSALERGLR